MQAQAAQAKLNEDALNDPAKQANRRLAESEAVDANVDMQIRIRMEHRQDIGSTKRLVHGRQEARADKAECVRHLISSPRVSLPHCSASFKGRSGRHARSAVRTPREVNHVGSSWREECRASIQNQRSGHGSGAISMVWVSA